jgi:hypothetical protein
MQLQQAERNYILSEVNQPTGTPINDLRRALYGSKFVSDQAEANWLRTKIVEALGTPTSNFVSDLWAQLLSAKGYPVSKNLNQNRKTYWELEVNI